MKRGYLLIVVLFSLTLFAGVGSAQIVPADCDITLGAVCAVNFTAVGKVSDDGHFDPNVGASEPYTLCCKHVTLGAGIASFNYSGDGHISVNSTLTSFPNGLRLGFGETCSLKPTCDLPSGEICIARIANATSYTADNSHLADCDSGEYGARLCCEYIEGCTDGADNDGDGFIDCADEDCKQGEGLQPIRQCTGSPYTQNTCLTLTRNVALGTYTSTYNPLCYGQNTSMGGWDSDPLNPPYFYCSYSEATPGTGICCQTGTKATYDVMLGWYCGVTAPCGIDSGKDCNSDFDSNRADWFADPYDGDEKDWCFSRMPNLFTKSGAVRSIACCLGIDYGEVGYYTNNNNVRIFGTTP